MIHIPKMFIPSFYGDIRLEPDGARYTRLIAEKVTAAEAAALQALTAIAVKKAWVSGGRVLSLGEGTHLLEAPLLKVQKALTKLLKPGRTMVTAVKFVDGTMEEVSEAEYDDNDVPAAPSAQPGGGAYREPAVSGPVARAEKKEPVEAATTVAKPKQGCPAPDFVKAELKARQVLEVFLDDEQIADFRQHNQFMSVGQTTGHTYLITSRHARGKLEGVERTLYDVTDDTPFCVHDWSVPAAEEMLALHVMLQLPGHELFLRHLEHD